MTRTDQETHGLRPKLDGMAFVAWLFAMHGWVVAAFIGHLAFGRLSIFFHKFTDPQNLVALSLWGLPPVLPAVALGAALRAAGRRPPFVLAIVAGTSSILGGGMHVGLYVFRPPVQLAATLLIVALAAAFVAWRAWAMFRGGGKAGCGSGCGSCPSNSANDAGVKEKPLVSLDVAKRVR